MDHLDTEMELNTNIKNNGELRAEDTQLDGGLMDLLLTGRIRTGPFLGVDLTLQSVTDMDSDSRRDLLLRLGLTGMESMRFEHVLSTGTPPSDQHHQQRETDAYWLDVLGRQDARTRAIYQHGYEPVECHPGTYVSQDDIGRLPHWHSKVGWAVVASLVPTIDVCA